MFNFKYIEINEKDHVLNVYVSSDQARLAFGKRAQNVRLSSKLVCWNLKIIEEKEEVEPPRPIEAQVVSGPVVLAASVLDDREQPLADHGFLALDIRNATVLGFLHHHNLSTEGCDANVT